ncbi:MAG: hypothetical protein ACRYGI_16150 [Janthinobacterium lividum]
MDRHGPLLKGRRVFEAVLAASLLCGLSIVVVGRPHAPAAGPNVMSHPSFQQPLPVSASPSLVSLGIELHPPIHMTDPVADQDAAQPGG